MDNQTPNTLIAIVLPPRLSSYCGSSVRMVADFELQDQPSAELR
jgi:hypothetical protein